MTRFDEYAQHDERWQDEVAAYAIGALDESGSADFEAHLAGCPRCESRLQWLAPAADLLPESVPQVEPPPELRERLLATIAEQAVDADAPAPAISTRSRRRLSWRLPALQPGFAAAVAVVALLAAGVTGWVLNGGGEQTRTISASVAPAAGGAKGTLVVRDDSATLEVHRMPRLSRDEVFQVWVREDANVDPSTLFVVSRGGSGEAAVNRSLEGADEVLVTREPAGGSEQPTSQPLMSAGL